MPVKSTVIWTWLHVIRYEFTEVSDESFVSIFRVLNVVSKQRKRKQVIVSLTLLDCHIFDAEDVAVVFDWLVNLFVQDDIASYPPKVVLINLRNNCDLIKRPVFFRKKKILIFVVKINCSQRRNVFKMIVMVREKTLTVMPPQLNGH